MVPSRLFTLAAWTGFEEDSLGDQAPANDALYPPSQLFYLRTIRERNSLMSFQTGDGCLGPICWSTFAIKPVQPVWWLAPRPAPLSPWKYS